MAENRRQTRFAVTIAAELTLGEQTLACTITNLSLGGAFLAQQKLTLSARCRLKFSVPIQPEPIIADATVRWNDDQGVGLQFDGLRAREVWALNKLFESLK